MLPLFVILLIYPGYLVIILCKYPAILLIGICFGLSTFLGFFWHIPESVHIGSAHYCGSKLYNNLNLHLPMKLLTSQNIAMPTWMTFHGMMLYRVPMLL